MPTPTGMAKVGERIEFYGEKGTVVRRVGTANDYHLYIRFDNPRPNRHPDGTVLILNVPYHSMMAKFKVIE